MTQGIVKYFCENCKRKRQTVILPDDHQINLTSSANGLVIYSDVHVCKDHLIGVSNVHLDANYAVRGVDYLKLPQDVVQEKSSTTPMIPIPGSRNKITKVIPLTDIVADMKIKLIYRNFTYKFDISIGKIDKNEQPVGEVSAPEGSKILFYECDIEFDELLEEWLQNLVNLLETHYPKKLGLVLEAIIYIIEDYDRKIEDIDIKIIHEMFHSHKVQVNLQEDGLNEKINQMKEKFDDRTVGILKTIIADLRMNPDQTLLSLAGLLPGFVKFLLNIYILEKFEIVRLIRSD